MSFIMPEKLFLPCQVKIRNRIQARPGKMFLSCKVRTGKDFLQCAVRTGKSLFVSCNVAETGKRVLRAGLRTAAEGTDGEFLNRTE